MKFRCAYDDFSKATPTPYGSRVRIVRRLVVKDGNRSLVDAGTEDIQDFIQSFVDSCDISMMVQRYLRSNDGATVDDVFRSRGDTTALTRDSRPAQYADVSGISPDFRENVDNIRAMNDYVREHPAKPEVPKKEEVKPDEQAVDGE